MKQDKNKNKGKKNLTQHWTITSSIRNYNWKSSEQKETIVKYQLEKHEKRKPVTWNLSEQNTKASEGGNGTMPSFRLITFDFVLSAHKATYTHKNSKYLRRNWTKQKKTHNHYYNKNNNGSLSLCVETVAVNISKDNHTNFWRLNIYNICAVQGLYTFSSNTSNGLQSSTTHSNKNILCSVCVPTKLVHSILI